MKKIIIVLIVLMFLVSGCAGLRELAISGGQIAKPVYPSGEQLLISKVNGQLICRDTGQLRQIGTGSFSRCTTTACGSPFDQPGFFTRKDNDGYRVYFKKV